MKLPEDAPFPAGLLGAVNANAAEEVPAEEVAADLAPVADAAGDTVALADEAPSAAVEDTAAESEKE